MRSLSVSRFAVVLGLGLALVGMTRSAAADEEFDVSVQGHRVQVKTKGKWHINKEYPWRLMVGKTKVEGVSFELSEGSATAEAPKGSFKVRGGVCSGEQCVGLEKEVTIQ